MVKDEGGPQVWPQASVQCLRVPASVATNTVGATPMQEVPSLVLCPLRSLGSLCRWLLEATREVGTPTRCLSLLLCGPQAAVNTLPFVVTKNG